MARKSDPEEQLRLPIKIDATTNGEFFPEPLTPALEAARREAMDRAADCARRLGWSRREFLRSSCGAATALLALNELSCGGGSYAVSEVARLEPAAGDAALSGDEFIFDVQTHHVSTDRQWWTAARPNMGDYLSKLPNARCGREHWSDCFARDVYFREFQERFGYPELTPAIKAKIFGLNAARVYGVNVGEIRRAQAWDPVARARLEYRNAPAPAFRTHGPRTRREMLGLLRAEREVFG